MKTLVTATFVLVIVGIFSGCKKDAGRKPDCRITTITTIGGDAHILYNSDGKIDIVYDDSYLKSYRYAHDSIIILTLDASRRFASKTIAKMNADGLAINARTEFTPDGLQWNNASYEYNGTELVKSTVTYSNGNPPSISTYTWSNGNMVSQNPGAAVFDYYIDKPSQKGDFFYYQEDIVQGFETIRNKNLCRTYAGSDLTYSFSPEGNITTFKATSSNSAGFVVYKYECN